MENPALKDVCPIENGGFFSQSCVFSRVYRPICRDPLDLCSVRPSKGQVDALLLCASTDRVFAIKAMGWKSVIRKIDGYPKIQNTLGNYYTETKGFRCWFRCWFRWWCWATKRVSTTNSQGLFGRSMGRTVYLPIFGCVWWEILVSAGKYTIHWCYGIW